jgi:hypothetical protein
MFVDFARYGFLVLFFEMAEWSGGNQLNRPRGDLVQTLLNLRKGSYSRDDDIFCTDFLRSLCQFDHNFDEFFINYLQNGIMTDKCLLMDRPNLSVVNHQIKSVLPTFLERGVEYLLSRLYSLNSVCHQSNDLQPIPNCINNSNNYNNGICINPTHFKQVQSSSFKPFDDAFQTDPFPSFPNEAFQDASNGPVFSTGFNSDLIDSFTFISRFILRSGKPAVPNVSNFTVTERNIIWNIWFSKCSSNATYDVVINESTVAQRGP